MSAPVDSVVIGRSEPLQLDPIGGALAFAMQIWCGSRDPSGLRRALLKVLAELEDT